MLGFVLSLTTVVGLKPNQTKIKLNVSKIKLTAILWKVVAKTTNTSTEQIRNLTNQMARWYEVLGMCITNPSFKSAKKIPEKKTFLKEKKTTTTKNQNY